MASKNLCIDLHKVEKDRNGKTYYVGKVQFPGTLNFKDGVSFLVFTSEEGAEQLQISIIENKK